MKSKFCKMITMLSIVVSTTAVPVAAQAYWHHGGGVNVYVGPGYYNSGPEYYAPHGSRCRFVPAHWAHGYWHPSRSVCGYEQSHCGWVPGHWEYGVWHPGRRACWY